MPLQCPPQPSEVRLPGRTASVGPARRFVAGALRRLDLDRVVDDAELAVTELVTNVVIHARTDMVVRVVPADGGARVEIHDGSPVMPTPGLARSTAASGRGLLLVEVLAQRWGAEPVPGGGKRVWFEIVAAAPADLVEPTAEDLLEMWAAFEEAAAAAAPAGPSPQRRVVVLPDVPVAGLLESRAVSDDLVRDLQVLLLSLEGGEPPAELAEQLRLARRLDAEARAADAVRGQLRHQGLQAVSRGADVVELQLVLGADDADAALELDAALEEARRMHHAGLLPSAEGIDEHAALRHWFLTEIAAQLR
ncbi:ATP-binding protein [Kineococcus glutinatus]|uniref:Histidine kinase/HSP90-like ATPase domain-containing protein n=1 Tax=Kineococcus glutinatus TaxID=1070872 RepID=A0ABP9I823_9ACTN